MGHTSQFQVVLLFCILLVALLVLKADPSFAQHDENQAKRVTNLDLLRSLAKSLARQAIERLGAPQSTRVHLTVYPRDVAWIVEGGISEALQASGFLVSDDEAGTYQLSFGLDEARVQYANVRRNGFLGEKIVDRLVLLRLSAKAVNRPAGGTVTTFVLQDSVADTLPLSELPSVEHPAVPLTQGNLPREGFFSNLVEPLIIIGSIALAVLLLFHVRS